MQEGGPVGELAVADDGRAQVALAVFVDAGVTNDLVENRLERQRASDGDGRNVLHIGTFEDWRGQAQTLVVRG
jgi:hypothetical protein